MRREEEEKSWTGDPIIAEEMRQQSSRAREEWLLRLEREEKKEEERWRQERWKRASMAKIQPSRKQKEKEEKRYCQRQVQGRVPGPVPHTVQGPVLVDGSWRLGRFSIRTLPLTFQ
ncbi:unnamed protein product [Didymodactylos carnosus]|nr:unnamed protein product [Didymodactylos carnosus]CAF4259527.1 unnamed protein product [Didymodactylos carnosus]